MQDDAPDYWKPRLHCQAHPLPMTLELLGRFGQKMQADPLEFRMQPFLHTGVHR